MVPSFGSFRPFSRGRVLDSSIVSGYSIWHTLMFLISSGEKSPNWISCTVLSGANDLRKPDMMAVQRGCLGDKFPVSCPTCSEPLLWCGKSDSLTKMRFVLARRFTSWSETRCPPRPLSTAGDLSEGRCRAWRLQTLLGDLYDCYLVDCVMARGRDDARSALVRMSLSVVSRAPEWLVGQSQARRRLKSGDSGSPVFYACGSRNIAGCAAILDGVADGEGGCRGDVLPGSGGRLWRSRKIDAAAAGPARSFLG